MMAEEVVINKEQGWKILKSGEEQFSVEGWRILKYSNFYSCFEDYWFDTHNISISQRFKLTKKYSRKICQLCCSLMFLYTVAECDAILDKFAWRDIKGKCLS